MLNAKQVSVIGLVILLIGALFALDIKGLVKEEGKEETPAKEVAQVSLESVSETAKMSLNANLAAEIESLENAFRNAGESEEQITISEQLAQKWDDVNQPAPAAFYSEIIAKAKPDYANWL